MIEIPYEIFLKNKYTKWYFQLIEMRLQSSESIEGERHHWIPYSIAKNSNTVLLTFREHYITHLLLIKAVQPCFKNKMMYALTMMRARVMKQCIFNSKLFEILKTRANASRANKLRGQPKSEQHKQKLRKPKSEEHKTKLSEAKKRPLFG